MDKEWMCILKGIASKTLDQINTQWQMFQYIANGDCN